MTPNGVNFLFFLLPVDQQDMFNHDDLDLWRILRAPHKVPENTKPW